jgi:hypothetical protein
MVLIKHEVEKYEMQDFRATVWFRRPISEEA